MSANPTEHGKRPPRARQQQPVTLPPSLHLQVLTFPGWNFSVNHTEHLQCLRTGQRGQVKADLRRVLLRLRHLYEGEEDPELSQPVTVNLKVTLQGIGRRAEADAQASGSLGATAACRQPSTHGTSPPPPSPGDTTVTIHPKEIRTFFVHFQKP
ncbi:epididymis-specific alpha-mannosidase [Erinaceus europaeus]|uniref:Epididymis-specific alpha-mannosidase n=1 Tax=Erinaceus europaeus TaxID=9365 RepID=A0ABM3X6L1_ERIEU|nr:epididymis-specific alpha-mannosidase [Erinaceus europaeus]